MLPTNSLQKLLRSITLASFRGTLYRVVRADVLYGFSEDGPYVPRPLYNLGLVWDGRGYVREARRFYADALNRDGSYLPALRAAIRADSILREGSDQTLEWLEKALMLEQDPKWQQWMKLQRVRIEQQLDSRADS